MKDADKSRRQLLRELVRMRQTMDSVERLEAERRLAEEQRREVDAKWRSLAENAPDSIMTIDEDGTILFINRLQPGFTRDDLIGNTVYEFLLPEFHESFRRALRTSFRTGRITRFEGKGPAKNPQWFLNRLGAVRHNGRIVGVTMVSTNIDELKRTQEVLRGHSRRVVEAEEIERARIARELHDQIGQSLTGLKLLLGQAARAPSPRRQALIEEAQGVINETLDHVRDLSLELRPSMLDDLGLLPTVQWHIRRYSSHTGIAVTLEHRGVKKRFTPEIETAVYRIVQEALTNVARHARTPEARVRLMAGPARFTVVIEDRGVGFDSRDWPVEVKGRGLIGMRERAIALRGKLSIDSKPGGGTRVTAVLPLRDGPERGEGSNGSTQDRDRR